MEEEDPVIQEIPVFLSQALSEHLYIYQYPARPANRDWKDVKVINASVKPKNQLVRMEIGLDTYSEKYCYSKGEQIALNTDGQQESRYIKDKEKERSQYFRNGIMDKIVYESSTPCVESKHYAVALLQDKELHCTPIKGPLIKSEFAQVVNVSTVGYWIIYKGICQLRPSYSYYDKQDKRKVDKNKSENSDDEEKEVEPQQVTVKFSRAETDVAKKAREKSYESISQRIANEPWYDALWRNPDDDHADLERLKLFSSTTADGSALTLSAAEYITTLVPPLTNEAETTQIKKISLQDQIKEILLNAKLLTFPELRSLVRCERGACVSEGALLAALGGAACCVRGLWAPRSQQLYTRAAPAPPRLMCAARDHVLYLFTQHSYVDRRKITAAVRLPGHEVLEILRSVAKLNPQTGWELLLPPDTAFEAKYPEVIQRQNLYWEACQRQFNEMLIGDNLPKRQRKKSQRDSVSSDTMLSPRPRNYSVSEEDDRKRKMKMVSSVKRTRNVSSSSAQDAT